MSRMKISKVYIDEHQSNTLNLILLVVEIRKGMTLYQYLECIAK